MTAKNNRLYKAEKGCFIMRLSDGKIMGESICLGTADSIENYEDIEYTEEQLKDFYREIGVDVESEKFKKEHGLS